MLFAMQMWSRNGKTTVSQQNWKNGFRKHSRFLLAALVVPTLIFTGCMTHPGDGYVVGDNDWVFNRVEVDRADEREKLASSIQERHCRGFRNKYHTPRLLTNLLYN